uniref:Uncharacterized protein n=1 Tax=Parascaris univalens TaxID=6257 RepID=A0A915BYR3_PARUN
MDRGDILSRYKYVVLTEGTIERIRDIERVIGKARVRKAMRRWLLMHAKECREVNDMWHR